MHFIDGDRLGEGIALAALVHPGVVAPGIALEGGDPGGGAGAYFVAKAKGIGFFVEGSLGGMDVILVAIARLNPWDKPFPHSPPHGFHGMLLALPLVEVSHHLHPQGSGGPQGKMHPSHPVHLSQVRPHFSIEAMVLPCEEQAAIVIAPPQPGKLVRVIEDFALPLGGLGGDLVVEPVGRGKGPVFPQGGSGGSVWIRDSPRNPKDGLEKVGMVDRVQGDFLAMVGEEYPCGHGFRCIDSHHPSRLGSSWPRVRAEDGARIRVLLLNDGEDGLGGESRHHG